MLYAKYKPLLCFAIVGCINTGIDFAVFSTLHSLFGVQYLICQSAGYTAGVINSFVMNKIWTFENRHAAVSTSVQFVKFIGVNLLSLSVSLIGMKFLKTHLGLNIYLAKVMVTVVTQAINYCGYRLWVFKRIAVKNALG